MEKYRYTHNAPWWFRGFLKPWVRAFGNTKGFEASGWDMASLAAAIEKQGIHPNYVIEHQWDRINFSSEGQGSFVWEPPKVLRIEEWDQSHSHQTSLKAAKISRFFTTSVAIGGAVHLAKLGDPIAVFTWAIIIMLVSNRAVSRSVVLQWVSVMCFVWGTAFLLNGNLLLGVFLQLFSLADGWLAWLGRDDISDAERLEP